MNRKFTFKWDKNAIRKIADEAIHNIDAGIRRAVERYVCPEHHQRARFTRKGDGWLIEGCCSKVVEIAEHNVSKT